MTTHFKPFVAPEQKISELTIRAIILGSIIGIIMSAANTYLGLYAGLTVSASIPAAVLSMGILRGVLRRGTILENNIVQTIGSAGESLAAGIIFTMPALVIAGVWANFDYWTVTLVAIFGGILGVLFMIPLRRTLIVEEKELVYPEGVACGEVLTAGEVGGRSLSYIFGAMGFGAIFKGLTTAVVVIRSTVEGAVRLGSTALYMGSDLSLALVGVGMIIGINVSVLVFLGGAIGWLIGIPIYLQSTGGVPSGDALDSVWTIWSTKIRYIGVGAMVVGGIWSIIKVRHGIANGMREAILGYKNRSATEHLRTDVDMSRNVILALLTAVVISVFFFYTQNTHSTSIGLFTTAIMIIAAFFFVAVSSYIVGLVGSSNNPVSGMTICTVLFTAGLMILFNFEGSMAITATLVIAGVVCSAACTSGDVSQDLKTGHLVGATPRKQELAQLIGVLVPAFIIAPVLALLHQAYGIGTDSPTALKAPQATLFASLVSAMFSDKPLEWTMIFIGVGVGLALGITDEYLRKQNSGVRTHIMPVAVGIYLPLVLSVPILIGGLINHLVAKHAKNPIAALKRATLISSGLIAGEAMMGIGIAGCIFANIKLPIKLVDSGTLSLLLFSGSLIAIYLLAIKEEKS